MYILYHHILCQRHFRYIFQTSQNLDLLENLFMLMDANLVLFIYVSDINFSIRVAVGHSRSAVCCNNVAV